MKFKYKIIFDDSNTLFYIGTDIQLDGFLSGILYRHGIKAKEVVLLHAMK